MSSSVGFIFSGSSSWTPRELRLRSTCPNQLLASRPANRNQRVIRNSYEKERDGQTLEPLVLTEENVERALDEVKSVLGTLFGNRSENRDVGITGDVKLSDIEGPMVILRLEGRFWHKKSDVLARVANYLQNRIPEIFEVLVEDPAMLDDADK